jgi:hypothetical protein
MVKLVSADQMKGLFEKVACENMNLKNRNKKRTQNYRFESGGSAQTKTNDFPI